MPDEIEYEYYPLKQALVSDLEKHLADIGLAKTMKGSKNVDSKNNTAQHSRRSSRNQFSNLDEFC